ncbi:hypothetical protein JXA47_13760 [Candidatus Sumerlaeota bacterium]|nr:hypothetical protein [Candidatus Sumerlaeota bacterium]
MNVRRLALFARHLCDVAGITMWVGSAIGHAWLLAARWGEGTLGEQLMLVIAVLSSLVFAWLSRELMARPQRALIVALLVCIAHMPLGVTDDTGTLLPAIVAALSVFALLGLSAPPSLRADLFATSLPGGSGVADPPSPELAFALLCRPPPRF